MKQVILIHGAPYEDRFYSPETPSPSNSNWLPWLQKQLTMKDILCQALEFPKPYDPIYEQWLEVIAQMNISSETTLIGHSCGGDFLLRYLSENKNINPGKLILVAPWIDTDNYLRDQGNMFFDFKIDSEFGDRTEIHIMFSTDDESYISDSVQKIRSEITGIHYHEFINKGHFTEPDLGGKEFPELLEVLN